MDASLPTSVLTRRLALRLAAALFIVLAVVAIFGAAGASAEEDRSDTAVRSLAAEPTPTPTPEIASLTLIEPVVPEDDLDLVLDPETPEPTVAPDDGQDVQDEVDAFVAVEEAAPGPAGADITVVVHERLCPESVAAIAGDIDALTDACPDPIGGVMFLLNQEGVTTPAFTDGSGAVSWDDYALGTIYLVLNDIPGTGDPIVFCRDDVGNSPWIAYPVSGAGSQASIAAELTVPGASFLCSWYHTPAPRTMTVNAWSCPADIFAASEDVAVFLDACATPLDVIGFRLGAEERLTAAGTATWEGLAPEAVQIEQGVPDGFGQPAVFCASDESVAFTQYSVAANTIVYDYDATPGATAICHWFNIPDQGQVAVIKRVCPVGIDATSEDPDYFNEKCTDAGDGVVFHLMKDGVDSPQVFVEGVDWVVWEGIGAGTATVWEEIPAGFVQPVVFCIALTKPYVGAAWEYMAVDSGTIDLEFGETYLAYTCHWYNVPGDPEQNDGWLQIEKYACPPSVAGDEFADYVAACPALTDGITFTLDLNDGHAPFVRTTGDDGPGRVHFDLPDGTYSEVPVTEEVPVDVVGHTVFCDKSGAGFDPEPETDIADGTVWLSLEPGSTWTCFWYNLVVESETEGEPEDDGEGEGEGDGEQVGQGEDDGNSDGEGDDEDLDQGTDQDGGTPGGDEPGTPAVVVTTLPDTGAGPGTPGAAQTWIWPLVALMGMLAARMPIRWILGRA